MSYGSTQDDPIPLPDSVGASIGEDKPEDIQKAFDVIITEATENELRQCNIDRATKMIDQYKDIFRINLGLDPPPKVAPLQICIRDKANPYRVPQRRYATEQRDFIISTMNKL